MPSSKSSPSLQVQYTDPITPPPLSLQSPHVFKPVVSTSTPTESPHLFTPVTSAGPTSSKSTHNFQPFIFDDSLSPKSPHNFKPIIFDEPKSPKSPHNFQPVIFDDTKSPVSPHNFKPIILDEPKSPVSPHTFKPILVSPGLSSKSPRKSKSVVFAEPDVTAGPSSAPAASASLRPQPPSKPNPDASVPVRSRPSFIPAASAPVRPQPSSNPDTSAPVRSRRSYIPAGSAPVQPQPLPVVAEFAPPEAGFRRPALFKPRYRPYVPRPPPNPNVTFPNGLDGDNPHPRPYGGGWRNHRYHLFERLPRSKLLVDPYANPYKKPRTWTKFWIQLWNKMWTISSSHNHYGGRSAAQRESTRYVHRAANGNLDEAYEMEDLSAPKPDRPETPIIIDPKTFVGTAVTTLQAVRKDLKVKNVKAKDPGGNTYFYEKSYVPRFTKHSLRPSKRRFSIRNFLNRRLYGRPGDGANILMAHIPMECKIPGVDDYKERKALAEAAAKAKKKEHPLGDLDWLNNFDLDAEMKKVRVERKAEEKKKAKELKKTQKGKRKVPGFVSRWQERREKEALARAHRNYAKDVEGERKQKEKLAAAAAAVVPSSPPAIHHDNDLVEHHEPAEASREEQEMQRALQMEEARRGKKKVTIPVLRPESLRRDRRPLGVDTRVPPPSASAPVRTLSSALKEHGAASNHRLMLRIQLDTTQRAIAAKQRHEHDELLAGAGAAIKVEKEMTEAEKADRKKNSEKLAWLVNGRRTEKSAERLLPAQRLEQQEGMAEESLDITPPRLRTPSRYRGYGFEEAEQLVTPRSPEQAQFEANQAATPRTPTPYVLPSVEEGVDEEEERQIVDLTNSYQEFL
jgi:hypothetical protein